MIFILTSSLHVPGKITRSFKFGSYPIADIEEGATGLSVVGKGLVASAFVGLYSFTAELAPTTVRNAAMSFGSACARVGGMAAPYVGGPLVSHFIHANFRSRRILLMGYFISGRCMDRFARGILRILRHRIWVVGSSAA